MKRKIIISAIIAIVVGLVIVGFSTGVLTGTVFPMLKKAAMAVPPRMWMGLLFKLLILTGLMGYVTKKVHARKDRFLDGEIEYRLERNYSLIVGYDFQTKPLIKRLLAENSNVSKGMLDKIIFWCSAVVRNCVAIARKLWGAPPDNCVLLITDRDVRDIRTDMMTELTKAERKRLLFMRRDLARAETYANLRIRGARAIYMMGDAETSLRDGIILQASKILAEKMRAEVDAEKSTLDWKSRTASQKTADAHFEPVKVYLQFDDPSFYSQMRSKPLPMDPGAIEIKDEDGKVKKVVIDPKAVLFDLEVFNYYDSWVWRCWSEKGSTDGNSPYLPLRFKAEAERVELFVIGSGKAMKAVVDTAITLMNYGEDTRHCRMTVVSDRIAEILPGNDVIKALPELEIVEYSPRDINGKVAATILENAADEKAAVTIVLVDDAPEKVLKTYLELPFAIRDQNVSVLMWMETQTRNLPEKSLIQIKDHGIKLRYFGMTDILPWYGSNRQELGVAVQYYYSDCYNDARLPKGTDSSLLHMARVIWDDDKATQEWMRTGRWDKWASICSAGSFKEKMSVVCGRKLTPELQLKLLKAEHNRWWAACLLEGWRLGTKDKEHRIHNNLVPFEELDDFTKDIDKLCIAAMAQQGFIAAT